MPKNTALGIRHSESHSYLNHGAGLARTPGEPWVSAHLSAIRLIPRGEESQRTGKLTHPARRTYFRPREV